MGTEDLGNGGAVLCPASTLRPRPSDRSEARLPVEHVKAQARQGHRQSRRP